MFRRLLRFTCFWTLCSIVLIGTARAEDISLTPGWNLKSAFVQINVASAFGTDNTKYASVWKWVSTKWAVYLVSDDPNATSTYAQAKGFSVLSTISPGEGFWVNSTASTAQTVTVESTPVSSNTISLTNAGWNLKGLTSSSTINVADVFQKNLI